MKNNKTCSKGLIKMYYPNIPIILLLLLKICSNNNINILKSYIIIFLYVKYIIE